MNVTRKRNGKIDFMKFIFSVIIVIHHSFYLVGDDVSLFLGGSFAVEFFFIVSGYLMMASIHKSTLPNKSLPLGTDTRQFIFRKFKSLCPELFVSYAIALVFVSIATGTPIIKCFIQSFFEIALADMSGLRIMRLNAVTWYLSSMLLCMAILYPLVKKYRNFAVNILLPLLIVLIFGYFCANITSPRNPSKWLGLTYKGNLRALAELSMGICAYPIIEKIKQLNFTKFTRILLTVTEYTLYVLLIVYMYQRVASREDYFYLLLYAIAIILSFSEKGIDAEFFCNRFSNLGKFSLCLYLSHVFYAMNLNSLLPAELSANQQLAVYYSCSIVTAFAVLFISAFLRKIGPKVGAIIKRVCIVQA